LGSEERGAILKRVSEELIAKTAEILAANKVDLANAKANNLGGSLLKRLALTKEKIQVLAEGITSLAKAEEPL
ncbi:unnamed protein product, partial [Discosporangium mesarthrocarpum]